MERKSSKANEEAMQREKNRAGKKSMENVMERNENRLNTVRSVTNRIKTGHAARKQNKNARSKSAAVSCGVHLDSSMSVSAESRFKRKNSILIRQLSNELALSYNEIESLLLIYHKIEAHGYRDIHGMTNQQFVDILHQSFNMTNDKLNQHVATILHLSHTPAFSMESWVKAIALFVTGTFEEKMKHCYSVYDFFKKNNLRKDHLVDLMDDCFMGEAAPNEIILDLIEMVLKKMDIENSGNFSYESYRAAVIKQPLLMESFGQCLPDRLSVQSFLTTFTHNRRRF